MNREVPASAWTVAMTLGLGACTAAAVAYAVATGAIDAGSAAPTAVGISAIVMALAGAVVVRGVPGARSGSRCWRCGHFSRCCATSR